MADAFSILVVFTALGLFKYGIVSGALGLPAPAYRMFGLKRSGIFRPAMGPRCVRIILVAAGTMLLT